MHWNKKEGIRPSSLLELIGRKEYAKALEKILKYLRAYEVKEPGRYL